MFGVPYAHERVLFCFLGNGTLPSDSPQTNRTRITSLPQPQRASYSIGLLEPITEREPDSPLSNQIQGGKYV
ncbi:hypothetical protein ACTXT7_016122 [Hymenolepis weldensis]